ncbi:MAG: hypothetical protein NDI73_00990 [Desulfuromonadales bacterium]|nr:hypothetical protein [Desulfuromonadales bacterium]
MNLLQRTNQAWKAWVFVAMLTVGGIVSLLQGFLYASLGKELAIPIAVVGIGLVIGSFIFAGFSIVCPKCELKLFIHAFRERGFLSWFSWIVEQESCPRCGHPEKPRTVGAKRKTKGMKRP